MVSVTIFDLYNKSNFFSSLMCAFPQNVIPYGNYIRFFYTENVEFLTNWSSKNPEYSLLCTDLKYTGLMYMQKQISCWSNTKAKFRSTLLIKSSVDKTGCKYGYKPLQCGQYKQQSSSHPPIVLHCQFLSEKRGKVFDCILIIYE